MAKRMSESTKSAVKNEGIPKIPLAPTPKLSGKDNDINPYASMGNGAMSGGRNGSGRLVRSATGRSVLSGSQKSQGGGVRPQTALPGN